MTAAELVDLIVRAGLPQPVERPDGTWSTTCPDHDLPLVITQNGTGATTNCGAPFCTPADIALHIGQRATTQPKPETKNPLADVREALELPRLRRFFKRGKDGNAYDAEYDHPDDAERLIPLGNAEALYNQNKIRAKLLPATGHSIPRMKAQDWDAVVSAIDRAAELLDAETDGDEMLSWLAGYLRSGTSHIDIGDQGALFAFLDRTDEGDHGTIITPDGRVCVRLRPLRKWINREGLGFVTQPELGLRLSRLGFRKPEQGGQLVARQPGNAQEKRSGRYWVSPPDFDVPPPAAWRRRSGVPGAPSLVRKIVPDSSGDNGDTGTHREEAAKLPLTTGANRGHTGGTRAA